MILNVSMIKTNGNQLRPIGRIDVIKDENNIKTTTTHYYILSKAFDLDTFIKIPREHWNIECSLHWRLDVILDEDHSRSHVAILLKI